MQKSIRSKLGKQQRKSLNQKFDSYVKINKIGKSLETLTNKNKDINQIGEVKKGYHDRIHIHFNCLKIRNSSKVIKIKEMI